MSTDLALQYASHSNGALRNLRVMNCRVCKCSLFGVAMRRCPQCDTPFSIEEFRFPQGSVRFCCPHCDQAYLGVDAYGLPVPREFECTNCRQQISVASMVVRPPARPTFAPPPPVVNPWQRRDQSGWFRGFLKTVWLGATNPYGLIRGTDPKGSSGIGFSVSLMLVMSLAAFLPFVAVLVLVPLMVPVHKDPHRIDPTGTGFLISMAVVALVPVVLMLIMACLSHLVLYVSGDTDFGFCRTMQAYAFTAGPMILGMIPCCGQYLVPFLFLWWAIVAGFALVKGQSVSPARAGLAVFVSIFVILAPPIAAIAYAKP
ncbi:MAG: hypothetical protein GC200_12055 [Tepidisphaera sp.]|nr:hypothetical protein [Tepidisphaera sp.]